MEIGIIGAGVAGLAMAWEALKQGHRPSVFEQAPFLGGQASTFLVGDQPLERGYHHLFLSDTDILELVDEIGLGAGVVDRLRQLGCRGLTPVNVSRAPHRKDLFQNLRAELAWQFREALERGEVALPDDDGLLAELSALRYDYDTYGRIRLEQKDEMRRRIGRSPDRADAAILGLSQRQAVGMLWSKAARAR